MTDIQQRYSSILSVREENGQTIISGLAVPYYDGSPGTEYELSPGYYERFQPGAFKDLNDVECNIHHDRNKIIGSTPDTLRLRETARGLEYDVILDESTYSKDAKSLVASRKLKGSSIGFVPTKLEQKRDQDKNIVWVRQATLDHIALVSRPAYKATDAYLRELQANTARELTALREARLEQILKSIK